MKKIDIFYLLMSEINDFRALSETLVSEDSKGGLR